MKKLLPLLFGAMLAGPLAWSQALLTVTSPNGGESVTPCTSLQVSYTKSATATDNQIVEVSFNAGKTYFQVGQLNTAGSLSGSTTVSVPNHPTDKARIRVRELNGGTNQSDQSDANFTIGTSPTVPPFFITAPVGLATYPVASTHRIQWGGPTDRAYKLSYSTSTTGAFQNIATVSGRNYYDWNIPSQSTRLYLRVQDTAEPCRVAYSDTLFRSSAAVPGIGLTSFNGGEVVQAGQSFEVTWNTSDITADTLVLEFSSNNGANWQLLSDSLPRTGTYGWSVPPIATTQGLFRLSVKGAPATNDVSNGTFTIQRSSITLTSQTVNGPLTGCQDYTIGWTAQSTSGFYKVILSANAGVTWYPASGTLAYGPTGTFSKTVKVPSVNSTQCVFAVIDPYTPSNRDSTNTFFTVSSSTPLLNLTNPTNGQLLPLNTPISINWTTAGSVPFVDVSYSPDGGQNWIVISTHVANTGSQAWTTPSDPTAANEVRVQASSDTCLASQVAISISNSGVVGIQFPTGGEQFIGGQPQTIRWTASGLGGSNQVKIEFSSDAGQSFSPVATVANTGSYTWTVPGIATSSGRIRISDASDASVSATSPGNFQILVNQPPTANAGPDIYIRLPANAVTINGNGSDPENGAVTYQWTQTAGPSTPSLINATSKIVTATPLVQGRYTFRLTVTDNGPLSTSDDVNVIVLPDTGRALTAWNWVRRAGGTGVDRGNRVATDAAGNVYVVGGFSGSASIGAQTVNSNGGMDALIAKYDSAGTLQWVRTMGGTTDDEALSVCMLGNGNIAVSGFFNGSFTSGGFVVASRGSQDIMLMSLTPAGDIAWLKSGGSAAEDQATAVASIGADIFVGGFVAGNGLFGNVATIGLGNRDAFAAKYDLNGNAMWVKVIGSATRDQGAGISASAFGSLTGFVLTGYVSGTVNIGGNSYPTLGGNDAFHGCVPVGWQPVGLPPFRWHR